MTSTHELPSELYGVEKWKKMALDNELISQEEATQIESTKDLGILAKHHAELLKSKLHESPFFAIGSGEQMELSFERSQLLDFRFKTIFGYSQAEFYLQLDTVIENLGKVTSNEEVSEETSGNYFLIILRTLYDIAKKVAETHEHGYETPQA